MSSSDEEIELLADLTRKEPSGEESHAELRTDDRVLARVSDGIYRRPGSALRELVANAYDADAKNVTIDMEPPRFSRISVRDDGSGMSKAQLVRLIHHIGGSAKRTTLGSRLHITSKADPNLSPGGRLLIGKIGIGLFSVSQLTRSFRIMTKRAGEQHRLIADIKLKTFSDSVEPTDEGTTKTGEVRLRSVKAKSKEHGTEIILTPLQPAARDYLRSKDIWARVHGNTSDSESEAFYPPPFHVGRLDPETEETITNSDQPPWDTSQSPLERFRSFYASVLEERTKRNANPKLEAALDQYLHTLWMLSLSVPLAYIDDTHPFDIPKESLPDAYVLSNKRNGTASQLKLRRGQTLRQRLGLESSSPSDFKVTVDGVELRRPLRFSKNATPGTRNPVLFVGKWQPDLSSVPDEVIGGRELSIEGYFLWGSKVIPVDHNGLLIRIADASGTAFDPTFLSYQVAERTRLGQVSSEIFAIKGLDAALNIDRESFNFGHPHAKLVSDWVHRGLREFATAAKRIQKTERETRRTDERDEYEKLIWKSVQRHLRKKRVSRVRLLPADEVEQARRVGQSVLRYESVFADFTPKASERALQAQIEAIATLLTEAGLLDQTDYDKQELLLNAILEIIRLG